MKPDFKDRTAKIIEEIRTKTFIDESIVDILKCELEEYFDAEITRARDSAYNRGYDDGYNDGYNNLL